MNYSEDVIKLFQDWVNKHDGKVYFTGYCNNGLPERICHTDYILMEDSIALQSLYLEYLQKTLGEYSILDISLMPLSFSYTHLSTLTC